MNLTQLKGAERWWLHNGHFNMDLLNRILEAKLNIIPNVK